MKITGFETIWLEEFPNLCWVEVHTDEGLTGLGDDPDAWPLQSDLSEVDGNSEESLL